MWVTLLFTLILSYLNLSACETCSKKCYINFCMDIALFCPTEFIVCGHSITTITNIQQLWNWDLVTIISEKFFHDTKVKRSKNLNFRIFGHSIVLFHNDDMSKVVLYLSLESIPLALFNLLVSSWMCWFQFKFQLDQLEAWEKHGLKTNLETLSLTNMNIFS